MYQEEMIFQAAAPLAPPARCREASGMLRTEFAVCLQQIVRVDSFIIDFRRF
jgi:hypothetical protein